MAHSTRRFFLRHLRGGPASHVRHERNAEAVNDGPAPAVAARPAAVRERIAQGLTADPRLADSGVAVVATRVIALRAEPEMERALQTPTREQVQQDADKATYERRAVAVERERAIAEN